MKAARIACGAIISVGVAISAVFVYNVSRNGVVGSDMPMIIFGGVSLVVLVAGALIEFLCGNRILRGAAAICSAVLIFFNGSFAFASVGAPAPQFLALLSIACMFLGLVSVVALFVLAMFTFTEKVNA